MRVLLVSMLTLVVAGCNSPSTLPVKVEGTSWFRVGGSEVPRELRPPDKLRLYYSVPDGTPSNCAGVIVESTNTEIRVTFIKEPYSGGTKLTATPVFESELGLPFVEFSVDNAYYSGRSITTYANGEKIGVTSFSLSGD